jgi:hypothetical protein
MANLTLTIPDNVVNRVFDALASEYHYNAITDGTKAAFAKKVVTDFLKRTVRESETSAAQKNSITTITSDIDTNITIS